MVQVKENIREKKVYMQVRHCTLCVTESGDRLDRHGL